MSACVRPIRFLVALLGAMLFSLPSGVAAQTGPTAATHDHPVQPDLVETLLGASLHPDSTLLANYEWRNIGPDRGGRSIAVSGVPGRPMEAYFGATGGGLWKTVNGGEDWRPVTDFQITSASVGAVAVSASNPELVFIGMGETCIRGNIMPGDGMYRSRDGGETWDHIGFETVDAISKIRVHPTDPDIVYAALFGKYSVPSEERGVYRSTDGGDSWERILFRDANTGAIDIVLDPNDPDVIYAALWEAYRKEYQMSSGGPGSGMFKSTDGGDTWTEMTRNEGMPADGVVGRIGLSVSGADSDRVYALFEHEEGGLYRSDDGGDSWALINDDRAIRQRAFYYTHVFADPVDRDVVYLQNTTFFRSEDGGESYDRISNGTHGDFHDLWIDPDDPSHLVVANDGGGAVSFATGDDWTDQEFSTAQFYHAVTTGHLDFHVCGSQQDNSTLCVPFDWNRNRFEGGTRGADLTRGSMEGTYRAGGGEPGYIAPDPNDLNIFYSGTNNGRYIDKYNRTTGISREVNPYPWFYSGEPAIEMVERWQWTFPIVFSPIDPNVLYTSSNRLWSTSDGGNTWEQLSPDLTRADPMTLQPTGGPITKDMNGPEVYATIFAVGPGKVDIDVIWTGSDDGLVHVTRDGGGDWTNVTPSDMPDFGRVSLIDASAFDAGRAYVAAKRPLLDDRAPYIWKTDDYGETWTKIVDGIPMGAYVHAVREDPTREGLLYAGTQRGVYISYDDGASWSELNPGLPDVPIVSMIVEENELVVASHGRGFWILDDIAALRQWEPGITDEVVKMFDPPAAYRSGPGARLSFWLGFEPEEATIEILAMDGEVLRTVEARTPSSEGGGGFGGGGLRVEAGMNTFEWNLETESAVTFPGMILWGARSTAPIVPPGRYTARLTADGLTDETSFEVRRNPWITDVTDADMVAQYEFAVQIRDRVDEANGAVIAIRRMKYQLAERLEASDDAALRAVATALETAASEVEGNLYQVKNRAGQDPLNFPIRVNNRLANLIGMVQRGDGRPNDGMYEVFDIMVERLAVLTGQLDGVWETEMAAVNAELRRLGLDELDPWDEETPILTPDE
jgi:photosystem II stability/assembly factor-like uncharacterized protein